MALFCKNNSFSFVLESWFRSSIVKRMFALHTCTPMTTNNSLSTLLAGTILPYSQFIPSVGTGLDTTLFDSSFSQRVSAFFGLGCSCLMCWGLFYSDGTR